MAQPPKTHCECGQPVTHLIHGEKMCERCYTLERRMVGEHKDEHNDRSYSSHNRGSLNRHSSNTNPDENLDVSLYPVRLSKLQLQELLIA